jgi:hypothetical protein
MKKRILLFVMVITMLVSAVVFAISSSAACNATASSTNIAGSSSIIASSENEYVRPEKLVDGSEKYGTFTGGGSFTFIFPQDKSLRSVKIGINRQKEWFVYRSDPVNLGQFVEQSLTNDRSVGKVKVQFLSVNDEVVWDSGEINTASVLNSILVDANDTYNARKVVVHIYEATQQWGNTPVSEVYIYEGSGTHDWALDSTISTTENPYIAADCVNNGMGTYKCSCGATKYDVIYSTGHDYGSFRVHPDDSTKHARICLRGNEGKCSEPAGTLFEIGDHVYDNACDANCNVCNAVRTVGDHVYVSDCDVHCNNCNLQRSPVGGAQHDFPYACTPKCLNCYEDNPNWVDHTYTSDCDTTCNFCSLERLVPPHVYNSECDEVCNVPNCGYERNSVSDPTLIPHTYTADCDTHCNNDGCVYVRQPLMDHPFKNKCDKNCDKCNEANPDYIEGHVYDNACDGDCNECHQKRTVDDHRYDNVCDINCNTCGAQRTVSKHIYGDWITLVPASKNADGMRAHYCVNCDKEETEVLPMIVENGLGTGAIVGIVVGCVVVVGGCAAIGVYSLVIKPKMEEKKRLAEEEAKRKAEEEDEEEYEDDEEYEDEESEEEEK